MFLASLTIALLAYANDVTSQREEGSKSLNQLTRIAGLLSIWLNMLSIFMRVSGDAIKMMARINSRVFGVEMTHDDVKDALVEYAHSNLVYGMWALVISFLSFVWREQNRILGIVMVVTLCIAPMMVVIFMK